MGKQEHMDRHRDPKTDAEWMSRYLQDDADAFASIYAAYSDAVYGYLMKRVRDAEERNELFQKIWMKFHRARGQWSSEYPLLQWIFVISRSVLIDRQRELARTALDRADHPGEELDRVLGKIPSAQKGPEETMSDALENDENGLETDALLARMANEGLTEDQIQVVRLRAIDEEEYEKIALRLGKTPANVRKIYSRAIEKLKTMRWKPEGGKSR